MGGGAAYGQGGAPKDGKAAANGWHMCVSQCRGERTCGRGCGRARANTGSLKAGQWGPTSSTWWGWGKPRTPLQMSAHGGIAHHSRMQELSMALCMQHTWDVESRTMCAWAG
jgi:hypothetical protein